jgi:two-component system KDP operon response regulator KdpE
MIGAMRVLVVDDEPQIVRALSINLRARHYDVNTAATGAEALLLAAKHPPDVVLLDLGLPDMDGVEVIEGIRGWLAAPIIVLSGRVGGADKVAALDAGADDYVTKPFGMDELMARMRAVARRANTEPGAAQPSVTIGAHTVDLASRRVSTSGGEDVRLTKTEWELLERIVRHPGQLVTQRQLLAEVWGPAFVNESGYLRFHFGQLRRKLEADPARPKHLITEQGIGYRFVE